MKLSSVRTVAAALLVPVIIAGAARAEDLVLICVFDTVSPHSFTSSPLVIGLDPGAEVAAVYDPLIYAIYGEPIAASQKTRGDRIELSWVVKNYTSQPSARKVNFSYTAKWNRAKGTISVRSHVHGYDNTPVVAYGSCKEERPRAKGGKRKG